MVGKLDCEGFDPNEAKRKAEISDSDRVKSQLKKKAALERRRARAAAKRKARK